MSVTIILQSPNTATITHTGAVSATIQHTGAVSATIQQIVGQGVSVQNVLPNSVTINTGGASGGGTWGSITGTITDQTDLVTYVSAERTSYAIQTPNGTSLIIVAGNDGTLAAIPPTSTAPAITTLPTISGTLNVGETLTATAGTVTGEPTPTQVLQWQRSDNGVSGWTDITGATGTTYLLGSLDEDKYIRVQQTEENILGTATANSASTGQIQPAAFTGILDTYSGAAAAYSLRKLSSTYSGNAIKVRRDSDQALQDIGFLSNGELDTTSLESFCSGTDGYVTTWYDQSGNAHNAATLVASEQPKIVSSGTTIAKNGKPCIDFNGNNNGYELSDQSLVTSLTDGTHTGISVHSVDDVSVGVDNTIYSLSDRNGVYNLFGLSYRSNEARAGYYNGSSWSANDIPASNDTQYLGFNVVANGTPDFYQNNTQAVSGNNPTMDGNQGMAIGKGTNNNWDLFGTIQELIFYPNDQTSNRSGIQTNINDFYSIY